MKDFPFESAGLPRDHGARNDGAAPITQGRGAQPVAASLSPDGQGADGVRAPAVKTERHPFAPPRRSPSAFAHGESCITGEAALGRSEEHTSELQSLMRISYAVFCLKKNIHKT